MSVPGPHSRQPKPLAGYLLFLRFAQVRGLADATRRGQAFTFGCELGFCGLASGLINSSQQIGGALGLAIAATIAAARTTQSLASGAPAGMALAAPLNLWTKRWPARKSPAHSQT